MAYIDLEFPRQAAAELPQSPSTVINSLPRSRSPLAKAPGRIGWHRKKVRRNRTWLI
jgi:hypothetical protein